MELFTNMLAVDTETYWDWVEEAEDITGPYTRAYGYLYDGLIFPFLDSYEGFDF